MRVGRNIISSLSLLLRTHPNWFVVQGLVVSADASENVDQRSARETVKLKQALGEHKISRHEILYDPNLLRSLGLLHESMVSYPLILVI